MTGWLLALQLDSTIRVGDVLLTILTVIILPLLTRFGAALFEMRDTLRDTVKAVGKEDPPTGLLGDGVHIKRELRRHRDWLIEANIIHPGDRT